MPLSNSVVVRKKSGKLDHDAPDRWAVEDRGNDEWYSLRFEAMASESGTPRLSIHAWDDWYDYEYTRADGRAIHNMYIFKAKSPNA